MIPDEFDTYKPMRTAQRKAKTGPNPTLYSAHGCTLTVPEWAKKLGLQKIILYKRLNTAKRAGGDYENVFTSGPKSKSIPRLYCQFEGKRIAIADLARRVGISESTMRSRIHQMGWTVERAVSEPVRGRGGRQTTTKKPKGAGVVETFENGAGTGAGSHARESVEMRFFQ